VSWNGRKRLDESPYCLYRLVYFVCPVLAAGVAGAGFVSDRVVDFTSATAGRHHARRGVRAFESDFVFPGAIAGREEVFVLNSSGDLAEERTNIFADSARHFDVEAGLGGDVEMLSGFKFDQLGVAFDLHLAGAGDDFHPLSFIGPKMEFARINQAQRFLGAIFKKDRVANHFAVKINIGLGLSGNVFKFGGMRHIKYQPICGRPCEVFPIGRRISPRYSSGSMVPCRWLGRPPIRYSATEICSHRYG
jgi:hypothetical protein